MVIPNCSQMLIKFLLIATLSQATFGQFINKKWQERSLITPSGKILKISWAISLNEKLKGLSELRPNKMQFDQGLLFYYQRDDIRSFWMPGTFFNLDIIFLDKDFKVVGLERNIKHFKKYEPKNLIPATKFYNCRYVLELKSGMSKTYKIKKGSTLRWKNNLSVKKFLHSLGTK